MIVSPPISKCLFWTLEKERGALGTLRKAHEASWDDAESARSGTVCRNLKYKMFFDVKTVSLYNSKCVTSLC